MTVGAVRTPLALLVEALWSFAAAALFVQFFGQGDGPAPSIITVAAVVVASFALARVLQPASGEPAGDDATRGVIVSIVALLVIGVLTYDPTPWDVSSAGPTARVSPLSTSVTPWTMSLSAALQKE